MSSLLLSQDLLLLLWRYSSDTVLAFSTISFHLRQSCTCFAHFVSFVFFRSFLISSSKRDLGLPAGVPMNGFYLCILFTMIVSGMCVFLNISVLQGGIVSMWRVCVRRGGCIGSWWGKRREGVHWGDLDVDGWIILGWISRRWDVGIWTGLGWPRIQTGGGRLWVR